MNSLLLIAIYGKIWHVAHQQRQSIEAENLINNNTNSDANKIVLVIIGSYLGLYCPLLVYIIITSIHPYSSSTLGMRIFYDPDFLIVLTIFATCLGLGSESGLIP